MLDTIQKIDYKYNEGESIKEIQAYVNATYNQHYSRNKFQTTEFVVDCGHGTGFCVGNILKYAQRYGRKGSPEEWRNDMMKVIHYAIMQLHVHDLEYTNKGRILGEVKFYEHGNRRRNKFGRFIGKED